MHPMFSVPIALVIAIGALPMPYNYYGVLRWFATVGFVATAGMLYESKLRYLTMLPVCVAILFNPIFPIYLAKETWIPIDICSAILLLVLNYLSRKFHNQSKLEKKLGIK